ncbi:hypothetical protein EV426DRAFT_720885 [Tirmania nivea]|nr:hypothetical protein EV426DRAFT_720885 [Tirmania nivea]
MDVIPKPQANVPDYESPESDIDETQLMEARPDTIHVSSTHNHYGTRTNRKSSAKVLEELAYKHQETSAKNRIEALRSAKVKLQNKKVSGRLKGTLGTGLGTPILNSLEPPPFQDMKAVTRPCPPIPGYAATEAPSINDFTGSERWTHWLAHTVNTSRRTAATSLRLPPASPGTDRLIRTWEELDTPRWKKEEGKEEERDAVEAYFAYLYRPLAR